MSERWHWYVRCALVAAFASALSCGPAVSSGGRIQVSPGANGPTFTWDACTKFGVKNCGKQLKITAFGIKPLTCTVGGKKGGEQPWMWRVNAKGFGGSLTPPIRYGEVPANAVVETPAHALATGCRYQVVFSALGRTNESVGFVETFDW